MATHEIRVIGNGLPDTTGEVYPERYDVVDTGAAISPGCFIFGNTNTRVGLAGQFIVPQNFSSSATFRIHWTANGTTGDVMWDIDYLTRTAGEDMGAAITRGITNLDEKTATAFDLETIDLTATDGDFAVGDVVLFETFRDLSEAADTLAADAILFDIVFRYSDT
jgi:hypothetical protein